MRIRIHKLWGQIRGDTYFRMTIIPGMVLNRFLVFSVRIPGCTRNGSSLHPDLWFQKEFVSLWQNAQNSTLCPTELPRHFFPSFLYLLWHLSCMALGILGKAVSRDWMFLGCSSWLSLAIAANFHLFLSVPILKGKKNREFQRLNWRVF